MRVPPLGSRNRTQMHQRGLVDSRLPALGAGSGGYDGTPGESDLDPGMTLLEKGWWLELSCAFFKLKCKLTDGGGIIFSHSLLPTGLPPAQPCTLLKN